MVSQMGYSKFSLERSLLN